MRQVAGIASPHKPVFSRKSRQNRGLAAPNYMPNDSKAPESAHATNFIRQRIEEDLASGKYAGRHWGGKPGPTDVHKGAPVDPAKIRTRFPPEPNGYLHIGHAKSIC